MRATRQRLLGLLADGHFHSGQALGAALGVSRGAIWKQVSALGALGVDVFRVPGRGYRLARPLELLDRDRILAGLGNPARKRLAELFLLDSVNSTNTFLRERDHDGVAACIAEHQQAGRGRRGRDWISPFGANLYLSLDWPFASLPPDFAALGLAAGVAARRALVDIGCGNIQLKWPNDIYANGAKLGGILLEMRGEPPGPCRVIAGIGINVAMPEAAARDVDQPWTDLSRLIEAPSRNALAARLLDRWIAAFDAFERDGFAGFRAEWRDADLLAGCEVEVADGRQCLSGRARGVAADGALELETATGLQRVVAGDASLRRAES
ncbi:MAG TPA: bifunctional biotin--[acetyl-CoA-carboxylase] ligase/biotin operon repressor BirA [Gammaproteobacteria bacterium]